jgi:small subunit ribosomal protein S1
MTTKTITQSKSAFGDYLEKNPDSIHIYQPGEIVTGTVTAVTKQRIWVDIDEGRFVAIISNKELAEEGIVAPDYQPGDKVTASVLLPENDEGFMILSLRDALENQGWKALEERKATDEIFGVKVVEANRGGLIVEADGLRGFLPVSQLAPENYPRVGKDKEEILSRLAKFEGEMIQVKVLDLDKASNKLIFSERIARKNEFDELVSDMKVGDIVEGTVSGIVDFGIFVSLGRLEGLVHISEISWDKVDHPGNFAAVGDKLKVQVIGIEDDKISLSIKRLADDPWLNVIKNFQVGQVVDGSVTQIMPFGVFVKVAGGVDGLVHISELSHEHVVDPSTVVKVGDKVQVKVIDLGADSHRLGLSLKATQTPQVVAEAGQQVGESDGKEKQGDEGAFAGLPLTPAAIKKLEAAGITSRADLEGKTLEELVALPGIGEVSAKKIVAAMNK